MKRFLISLSAVLCVAQNAYAQPQQTELSAPLPPKADVKLTYGGTAGVQYRSNIFRDASNETSDMIAVVNPAFAIRSKNDDASYNLKANVKAAHYLDKDDNDFVDGSVNAASTIDLGSDALVQIRGAWRREHVDVGGFSTDLTDLNRRAKDPAIYYTGDVGAEVQSPVGNDFQAKAGAKAVYFNYINQDDTRGRRIIQDDRDRVELIGTTQLGYKMQPDIMPFVAVDVNHRAYREQVDSSAIYARDSTGGGVYGGLQLNNPEKDPNYLTARIGWLTQEYETAFLPDVDTIGFDGRASYKFNDATRIEAQAIRAAVENTLLGASGAVQTAGSATLYHTLSAQWSADAMGRVNEYDFSINPASGRAQRTDHLYEGVAGITYDIAAPIYVRGEYAYTKRSSNEPRARYTDNGVMMLVGMRY